MSKRYILQHITDRFGRVFFPMGNEDEENQREEYFDTYEEADKRLEELQKKGIYSTITEFHEDEAVAGDSEKVAE